MDIKKIKAIVDLVKQSGIAELEIAEGDDKLKITATIAHSAAPVASVPTLQPHIMANHHIVPPATNPTLPDSNLPAEAPAGNHITSPMVGTFYRSSSPTTQPFVEVGQEVKVGQVLCIIEAMKLMNQIESDQAGTIKEIHIKDGAPVEFGQPLFTIG